MDFTVNNGQLKNIDDDAENFETEDFIRKYFEDSIETVSLKPGESFGDIALKY